MRTMKRIGLALFMAMVLAMGVGCAKKSVTNEPQPAETTQEVVEQAPMEETTSDAAMNAEKELQEALAQARTTLTATSVYFDFDKFEIKAEYRDVLKTKAVVLKKFPQIRVLIEGHCDSRGTAEYNLALGERRARTVKEYLMVLGVSASQLEVVSYGEERPAVEGESEAAWAKNRRGEFKLIQ